MKYALTFAFALAIGNLAAHAAEDPLEPIAASMNGAAAGLDRADVGDKTQKSEKCQNAKKRNRQNAKI